MAMAEPNPLVAVFLQLHCNNYIMSQVVVTLPASKVLNTEQSEV